MAEYFRYYPKTVYAQDIEQSSIDVITNLVTRFSFEKKFKENTSVFDKYDIRDGDTPESIAYKIYDSTEKHWIVLAMNDIVDPQYDWPLDQLTLASYVNSKYTANANSQIGQSGATWARSNIHSYYKIEKRTTISSGEFVEDIIEIDASTYANIAPTSTTVTIPNGIQVKIDTTKDIKTYYEYEVDYNERNRTINLLKPAYVEAATSEFKRVIGLE
jgi:hypothetical protein